MLVSRVNIHISKITAHAQHQQPPRKLTTNSPQTHRHCTLHHKRHIFQVRSRSQLHDRVCQVLFYPSFERGPALSLLMDCGRFTGTVDELAGVLRRCVNHGVCSFVRYFEEASVHASNAVSHDQRTSDVHQELDGCCVADRWKGESEGVEFDKRSTRILDGDIGQALAEHVFACARWSKTVAVSATGAIDAMAHVGCEMRRLNQ